MTCKEEYAYKIFKNKKEKEVWLKIMTANTKKKLKKETSNVEACDTVNTLSFVKMTRCVLVS